MAPKRRLPHPLHFEQPFPPGAASGAGSNGPVVGAIVAGPLGALVQRAFSTAFATVIRARAEQQIAAAAKSSAKSTHPAAGGKSRSRKRAKSARSPGTA